MQLSQLHTISWVRTVWRTIVNLWLKPQFLGVSHMTVAKSEDLHLAVG